jgi:hypothetical protein
MGTVFGKITIMDSRLNAYVCTNPDMNCTWNQVQALEKQLATLGVITTPAQAYAQGVAAALSGASSLSYRDLVANGLDPANDKLYFLFQVVGSSDLQTAAEVASDLAPGTFNAVWKVMSDLFPGQSSMAMAVSAIAHLPGLDNFIHSSLS